jgi:hypothetical protein
MIRSFFTIAAAGLIAAGCATPGVDLKEPSRLLGIESGVRVDAQVFAQNVGPHAAVPFTVEITNQRSEPIAFADIVPQAGFDREAGALRIEVGSEVPGNTMVPRLIRVNPGEKRVVSSTVRLPPARQLATAGAPPPRYVQLKVNFLRDVAPFETLIGISEKAIADPELADSLFDLWVDNNESVLTNAAPMVFKAAPPPPEASPRPTRR